MGAAPAGLFRERLMEDPDSLLPGSIIKVFGDSDEVPGDIGAAPSGLFAKRAKEDPGSLLPGSVIRIY
jgi:hypothetical protein